MTDAELLYNTPQEIAMRLLIILSISNAKLAKSKLFFYDFLTLHGSIVDESNKSLHPDNPYFGLEFFSKEKNSEKAVHLLVHKKLVTVSYDSENYYFEINNVGRHILSLIDGDYKGNLELASKRVVEEFSSFSEQDVQKYFDKNLLNWSKKL